MTNPIASLPPKPLPAPPAPTGTPGLEDDSASIAEDGPEPISLAEMERMTRIQDRIWQQLPASGLGGGLPTMGASQ